MTDARPPRHAPIAIIAAARHDTVEYGSFAIHVAQNAETSAEHVVLTRGAVSDADDVLCRVQSECLTGMVLDAASCECREQLRLSLRLIAARQQGMLIFLRQEGRGHGLAHKVRALANKNAGYDTFAAAELMGDKPDIRRYDDAAAILGLWRVRSVDLMTNNPDKVDGLSALGVAIRSVTKVEVAPTPHTVAHLRAKAARGHTLVIPDE